MIGLVSTIDIRPQGSALDTWEPLIRIANGVGDEDWLYWAWVEIVDMDDALTNAQQWEIEHVILGAVVKAYCDRNRGQLDENNIKNVPLPLTSVTEAVRKQYAWVQPKTISTKLKRLGFKDIHHLGGTAHIFSTLDELKKAAEDVGYKDDSIK